MLHHTVHAEDFVLFELKQIKLTNVKLLFLPANTTSDSQLLDADEGVDLAKIIPSVKDMNGKSCVRRWSWKALFISFLRWI
ncbi:hypothetical protein R1flu_021324 [Riccia fluitans]|uniref:DDE-1 domain-containing protein n=1 Tax=Riccia fluitans TaxID=41844 RepID=A0ABD1ZR12_9MARC